MIGLYRVKWRAGRPSKKNRRWLASIFPKFERSVVWIINVRCGLRGIRIWCDASLWRNRQEQKLFAANMIAVNGLHSNRLLSLARLHGEIVTVRKRCGVSSRSGEILRAERIDRVIDWRLRGAISSEEECHL